MQNDFTRSGVISEHKETEKSAAEPKIKQSEL